ncbi:hypothetical protein [Aquimarina sp. I32.4]|uniref:hypothetical protein n=1 Tax=Aquimarina sp. I32.4 TaxID=2053903 RepID=UPI000CDE645C|nr:hypothetical protein [Aquimarina sp. I32.4]
MYYFTIDVSIRKGEGPEWYKKTYTVTYDDNIDPDLSIDDNIDPDLSIDDLKEWAKEDVRNQLRTSSDYSIYGENWVIEGVELVKSS